MTALMPHFSYMCTISRMPSMPLLGSISYAPTKRSGCAASVFCAISFAGDTPTIAISMPHLSISGNKRSAPCAGSSTGPAGAARLVGPRHVFEHVLRREVHGLRIGVFQLALAQRRVVLLFGDWPGTRAHHRVDDADVCWHAHGVILVCRRTTHKASPHVLLPRLAFLRSGDPSGFGQRIAV